MVEHTGQPHLGASSSTAEAAFPAGELASTLSGDDELVALCQGFQQIHSQWDERIRTTKTASYDEASAGGGELLELRVSWGRCLGKILERRPQTLRGALAKLEVASMWSEWSGQGDGSALAFLAEASRELRSFLPDHQVSLESSSCAARSDRRGRSSWLAHFRRLPWCGSRVEVHTSIGARRSQT
jgi:hypothetical protein